MVFQSCSGGTPVRVASLANNESKIRAEIISTMIEAKTDLNVRVTQNTGTHTEIFQALQSHTFDIYPDSIVSVYQTIFQKDEVLDAESKILDAKTTYTIVRKELLEKFNIIAFPSMGFVDSNEKSVSEKSVNNNESRFLFPDYALPLARKEILDQYPELIFVLSLLLEIVNEEEMIRMVAAVEVGSQSPKEIAYDFLANKGLL